MTDNIQKLYYIAGVYLCNMPDVDCDKECDKCEDYNPFTAEKQLELIKWLLHHKQTTQVELRFFENHYCISHCTEHEENDAVEYVRTGSEKQFEQALADLFNDMWQDLTANQKTKIKEILE